MICSKMRIGLAVIAALSLLSCGGQHLGEDTISLPNVVVSNTACQSENYPDGPYGVMEGSTIINHCFETSKGEYLSWADIHNDAGGKILLVTTSAGWCSACIEEQPHLEEWHVDPFDDGLRVVVTLFEDESLAASTKEYAADWVNRFNLTFPVVSDPAVEFAELGISGTQLGWYYDTKKAPMQMIIDLKNMNIVSMDVGASPETLYRKIQGYL